MSIRAIHRLPAPPDSRYIRYAVRFPWGETRVMAMAPQEASATIYYLPEGWEDEDISWAGTQYQTADARHDEQQAAALAVIDDNDPDPSGDWPTREAIADALEVSRLDAGEKTHEQIIREFLALPPEATPSAMVIDGALEGCNAWSIMREWLDTGIVYGGVIRLHADRPDWDDVLVGSDESMGIRCIAHQP